MLASVYILRSKGIIRFGNRRKWIRFHQILAGFGLTLILIHKAFRLNSWYSWLPLILALGSLITGLTISLVKTQKRQSFLLIHSLLSPLLLTSIVYHGTPKMNHDIFFPLWKEHQAACVQCHKNSDYKSYTCLTCHIHSNSSVLEPHSIHGVIPYDPTPNDIRKLAQCLNCHQTTIKNREYGKKRANWY